MVLIGSNCAPLACHVFARVHIIVARSVESTCKPRVLRMNRVREIAPHAEKLLERLWKNKKACFAFIKVFLKTFWCTYNTETNPQQA